MAPLPLEGCRKTLLQCAAFIIPLTIMAIPPITDSLYADERDSVSSFTFDDNVASVFNDMIQRSVPGYRMILEMIGVIAQTFAQPGSQCYDLGCSLGASTLSIRHNAPKGQCNIIAVDNSEAMIAKCRENIASDDSPTPVDIRCQDIQNTRFENASLITMNFTLQFIQTEERTALLKRINDGMLPGGALVLSEKIALADREGQELLTDLHHAFKRLRGYSELEIAQKRSALENVLIPDTVKTHRDRLHKAGFSQVQVWFQCFNFISLIAVK